MSVRIGMVDFDSSHCVEFTRRINHDGIEQEQWVDGARIVLGCPGRSLLSPERVPGFTREMCQLGVPLVDDPGEMLGKVDGVIIASVDGSVHWQRARPFLEAGVSCFVDKPFTCNLDEARMMVDLAASCGVPIFSASALRFAPELTRFLADVRAVQSTSGPLLNAIVYGPAPTRSRNPGLFHYGIHAVEMLFTLLGPNCEGLSCTRWGGIAGSEELGVESVTGCWSGERVGTMHGIRSGTRAYGFVGFCDKSVQHLSVGTQYFYRELLKQIVQFFETGRPPIEPDETLKIIAFIEAAQESARAEGSPVKLRV